MAPAGGVGGGFAPHDEGASQNAVFPALAGAEPRMSGRHYGVRASAAQRRRIAAPLVWNPISVLPLSPFRCHAKPKVSMGVAVTEQEFYTV